jgi:hypothetical protein
VKRPNERTLRIAACLGVDGACAEHTHAARTEALMREAAPLNAVLDVGGVALITGPSGAGKSTLLSLLARAERTVVARPLTLRQERTTVAALAARTPLAQWAGLLARFGLAEANVLVSRAGDLSAGERARLELSLAAARCERLGTSPGRKPGDGEPDAPASAIGMRRERASPVTCPCASAQGSLNNAPTTLLIDEWCSVLDRDTAGSVAAGAARWARERGVRLIGATAHSDLATAIGADIVITLNGQGERGAEWTGCGLSRAG